MTAVTKGRLYRVGGNATVAVTTALFASPFVLVALFLIERATGQG
jgi:hypothetical protein